MVCWLLFGDFLEWEDGWSTNHLFSRPQPHCPNLSVPLPVTTPTTADTPHTTHKPPLCTRGQTRVTGFTRTLRMTRARPGHAQRPFHSVAEARVGLESLRQICETPGPHALQCFEYNIDISECHARDAYAITLGESLLQNYRHSPSRTLHVSPEVAQILYALALGFSVLILHVIQIVHLWVLVSDR